MIVFSPGKLSRREKQVTLLVCEGKANKEVAAEMGIKEGTVKNYMTVIFPKLGVSNRTELAAWAFRNGYTR